MSASFYLDDRPCVIGAGQDEHHFPTEDSPCACGRWRSHDAADATRILTRAVDVAMACEHGFRSGHSISASEMCGGPPIAAPLEWTKMYACGCRERGEEQMPCERHASRASRPDTFFNLERRKSSSPRVIARITEEDTQAYRARCERCLFSDEYASLKYIADVARDHAITTGHPVLVEAL